MSLISGRQIRAKGVRAKSPHLPSRKGRSRLSGGMDQEGTLLPTFWSSNDSRENWSIFDGRMMALRVNSTPLACSRTSAERGF